MRALVCSHVFPRAADDANAPFLLTWAHALQAAGAQIAVVAPHDPGLPDVHDVAGVRVRRARYAPEQREQLAYRGEMHQLIRSPAGPLLASGLVGALAAAVRGAVRAGAPDVLSVHWWLPGAIAARLARVSTPTVVTVHGTDVALIESRPWLAPLARWALARTDAVVAVSSDLADRLEAATGRAADAVDPMPVAAAALEPLGEQPPRDAATPPRILAIGRLVPEKGFADLIDAVADIPGAPRVELVGDGPDRDALAARAERSGVNLDLPGRMPPPALRQRLAAADVVAVPSHREGLGLVAAEAALAGVPVVATDAGGTRDVLGPDGLIPIGDVPRLGAALAEVLADPTAARARSATVAQVLADRLAPARSAERTLATWRSVTRG